MIMTTLGELSVDGGNYGIAAPAVEYSSNLPTYLRITDICDDGTLDLSNCKSVDSSKAYKYILHENDIVFARTGNSTGRNYFYDRRDGEFVYAGFLIKFSLNPERVNPRYIKYYVQSQFYWDWIASYNTGSTRGNINAKTYESMPIVLPSRDVQDRIVKICDSISNKIRNSRLLNDYLTDLSSAIYNEFINRSSGKWGALSDIVDLIKEPISSRTRPELPYLPIDVIPMKRIGIEGFRPYEEAKSSLQLFKKDDIVIGAMRVYFHRVILTPCKGMTRNTCFVLRPRNKNLREFALLSCFQNETIEFANLHSKGSTMPYAVWKGSFENCPVFIPNEHDLEVFSIRMSPLIDKIRDIYKENSALINLRNGLLSQLLSGKIDLSKFN